MLGADNIAVLGLAIVLALVVAAGYDRLWPGNTATREDNLEREVRRLTRQVEALQQTIDMLSDRTRVLQMENTRLRAELGRVLPAGNWRAIEAGALRSALEKLSAEELRRMAFERFRPVYDGFSAEQSVQAQRLALLEYAENHAQLDVLRAAIAEINQAAFG